MIIPSLLPLYTYWRSANHITRFLTLNCSLEDHIHTLLLPKSELQTKAHQNLRWYIPDRLLLIHLSYGHQCWHICTIIGYISQQQLNAQDSDKVINAQVFTQNKEKLFIQVYNTLIAASKESPHAKKPKLYCYENIKCLIQLPNGVMIQFNGFSLVFFLMEHSQIEEIVNAIQINAKVFIYSEIAQHSNCSEARR